MRLVFAHNYYGSTAPSGENRVFEAERDLLRRRGHEVAEFVRHSDTIRGRGALGLVEGALSTAWNPWAAAAIARMVDTIQPAVVHAHNTFPLISPAIFRALRGRVARVVTLHNYRLMCAAGIPMREERVCTDCLDTRSVAPALRHGCYRGSRLATLPIAAGIALHRQLGTWTDDVDAFIVLTEFQRERMVQAGLPVDRVFVKPNFYQGWPEPRAWSDRDDAVVFAGRLSAEKGVLHLIDAWLRWGAQAPELRVVGDGPLRDAVMERVAANPEARIRLLGQLSESESVAQIARARLLVVPSICFEGFPMVVREAFAFGTPVAVSDIGPLPSIAKPGIAGLSFPPADAGGLLHTVRDAWTTGLLKALGAGARRQFDESYNEDVNYALLMDVYERAMRRTARRG